MNRNSGRKSRGNQHGRGSSHGAGSGGRRGDARPDTSRLGRQKGKIDNYTLAAKEAGYPARSVFKLEAIDAQYHLFRPGDRVLDLGCHPGSWAKYISGRVGMKGKVVGVDLTPTILDEQNITVFALDVMNIDRTVIDPDTTGFNAVVSDMAPNTTGIRDVDQARSLELSLKAIQLAHQLLVKGGKFVCKVFQGPDMDQIKAAAEEEFSQVRFARPPAVRRDSFEIYLVGTGFKGGRNGNRVDDDVAPVPGSKLEDEGEGSAPVDGVE